MSGAAKDVLLEGKTLSKAQVFARLGEGLGAGVTLITPNSRLSQSFAREFDAAQAARGLVSWESADVLPYTAFVTRLYEDALYSELAPQLPLLLTDAQEQALWEQAIRASSLSETLLSASAAAAQCRAAWELAYAWGLAPKLNDAAGNEDARARLNEDARVSLNEDARVSLNEDARVFVDWSTRYERATTRNRQTDAARLAQVIQPFLAEPAVRRPRTLVLYAFDIVTVQQRALIAALEKAGVEIFVSGPMAQAGTAKRLAFTAAKDEVLACARWARARMEANPAARIGVVVPDLSKSRAVVERLFSSVMHPSSALPENRGQTTVSGDASVAKRGLSPVMPFNISLGLPLNAFALVHDALLALELGGREIEFARASRLLRSPFLAGAGEELGARARLDALLRERAGTVVTLDSLLRLMDMRGTPHCAVLTLRLAKLAEFRKAQLFGAKPASEWARLMSKLLDLLGFPGERVLDSTEFQTAKKWRDVLAGFAVLDRVQGKMGYTDACQRLARMAADTVFQPEAHDVPIQVLGVLESAGLAFDHLWVTGLTDEAWPLPARPNPFVPIALQRAAGVPEADASGSLALDARITSGWRGAAGEVMFSHPQREGDRDLAPSPLITGVEAAEFGNLGIPEYADLRTAVRNSLGTKQAEDQPLERISGHSAPVLQDAAEPHSGGTGVFRDQAACPFRAFAAHRLGAEALAVPEPGLSAMDRGTLVHAVLAAVWTALGGKSNLDATGADDLSALLERAAGDAIDKLRRWKPEALQGRFADLEKARLVALVRDWLALEQQRPEFEVAAIEEKRVIAFGGVAVNAKLDRMDTLAGGGHAVLDYKTGAASTSRWLGERPEEPQLPLYALGSGKNVTAVAFARVKTGDSEFTGIGSEKGLIPGVKTLAELRSASAKAYNGWDDLISGWRRELDALGQGFAAGDARVDPKHGMETCKYCGQQPFCRINERSEGAGLAEGDDA